MSILDGNRVKILKIEVCPNIFSAKIDFRQDDPWQGEFSPIRKKLILGSFV
jgi:hypothetical protein